MKSFLKLIMIFIVMVLSFWMEPTDLYAQSVDLTGSIQNIKAETVSLVSNNLVSGEIVASEGENTTNSLGFSPVIVSFNLDDNFFLKSTAHLNESFIHNLSTNKQKVHQIRAP